MGKIEDTVDTINSLVADAIDAILYDDYFTEPGDKGVEVAVEHKGKLLKFRVKKSLTLAEKQAASDAAITISLDKEGTPTLQRMDQAAYTAAVLLGGLKWWPFEYSKGNPVPINAKTIARLDGALGDKIAAIILGQRDAQVAALDPFGAKSGAGSSAGDQQTQS